jgi:acetyl esterase/lipase
MAPNYFGEDDSWRLWSDSAPREDLVFEVPAPDAVISDVFRARLFLFKAEKPSGRAVLVFAGGGYTRLVIGKEWGIEPDKIGVCGLSSGGHLAACLVARYPDVWRASESRHVQVSSRPDFAIIGYAPISTNASGRTVVANKPPLQPPEKQALYEVMQPDLQLLERPPPTFIVYSANDDVVPLENAYRLHQALIAKGGSAELHVFADAPHGFALREKRGPVAKWPELCAEWLRSV